MTKEVICNKCGWISFAISRARAELGVKQFKEYINGLQEIEQNEYKNSSAADIKHYEHCFKCGGSYSNFRAAKPEEGPVGVTIQPIIVENYNEQE